MLRPFRRFSSCYRSPKRCRAVAPERWRFRVSSSGRTTDRAIPCGGRRGRRSPRSWLWRVRQSRRKTKRCDFDLSTVTSHFLKFLCARKSVIVAISALTMDPLGLPAVCGKVFPILHDANEKTERRKERCTDEDRIDERDRHKFLGIHYRVTGGDQLIQISGGAGLPDIAGE